MNVKKSLGIAYVQQGVGKDVLLMHGWGSNKESFAAVIGELSKNFKVTAIDLCGFGESDKLKTNYTLADYANRVEFFLGINDIKPYAVLGHSFGGRVAIKMLTQNAVQTEKLILVDSGGLIPKRSISYYIKIYTYKLFKKLHMNKWANKMGSNDFRQTDGVMRQTFVSVVNENLKPLLKDVKSQTLILWGENDQTTPFYMAKTFNKEIKNSGLVSIRDAGHFCFIDEPYVFNKVLNSFLCAKNGGDL